RSVVRHRERAESARPLSMDHALRNPLQIEMRHLLDQVEILHENRAPRTRSERVLIVADGYAGSRRQRFLRIFRRHELSSWDIAADSAVAAPKAATKDTNCLYRRVDGDGADQRLVRALLPAEAVVDCYHRVVLRHG